MEKQYITILIESLQKKSAILSELIGNSKNQAALLKEGMVDWDAFDRGTDAKSDLIRDLKLYSRMSVSCCRVRKERKHMHSRSEHSRN